MTGKTPQPPRRPIEIGAEAAKKLHAHLEIGLARAVLSVQPGHPAALHSLGTALTVVGRHQEALEADQRTVERLPGDATAWYNLACSNSNLERIEESLAALRKAVDLGWRDFPYMLQDPDLVAVRKDPRFREILDRKWGKRQRS